MMKSALTSGAIALGFLSVAAPASAEDGRHNRGRYYVGVAGGANFASDSDFADIAGGVPYDTGYAISGVVGYQFAEQPYGNFRTELEAFYSENDIGDNFVPNTGLTSGLGGDLKNAGAMVNVYYDMSQLNSRFVPFVGVGVGFSNVDLNIDGAGLTYGDDKTVFAYQAIAGVRYDLNDNWALTLDGRYVGVSDPEFQMVADNVTGLTNADPDFEYDSFRTSLGVQYRF